MDYKKNIHFVFLLVLFVPLLDGAFNFSKLLPVESENNENRLLIEKPEFDVKHLDKFPEKYEPYYNDHFMLRDFLIKLYHIFNANYLRESPIPKKAFIGEGNWLYFTDDEQVYDGRNTLSKEELKIVANELSGRKEYLKQRNCSLYVFIVPNKLVVYPENASFRKRAEQTIGELVADYVSKNSDVSVTYLLPALLKEKKKENPLLYWATDNHWSDYGAFIGYKEIMRQIRVSHPQLKELGLKDLTVKEYKRVGGNIAKMMNMKEIFTEQVNDLTVTRPGCFAGKLHNYIQPESEQKVDEYECQMECTDKSLPRLLVIRDSYSQRLIPFLSESFSQSTFLFDGWQYKLNEEIIDKEKPDIVVYEILEQQVRHLLDNQKNKLK